MNNVNQPAFRPDVAATVNLAATTASSRVQVQPSHQSRHVRIFNSGTVTVFIEAGDSTITASASTGMPIAAGTVEIISAPSGYIAAITSTGTATLYFTPGEGI